MAKRILIAIGAVFLLVIGGFIAWASITRPILPTAQAALESDELVQVMEMDGGWLVFTPAGSQPETGLVFYPGGRVDYRAYAPYARAIAAQGYQVVIVKMPLNMAVFNSGAARDVLRAFPAVQNWAVGGHSLGGSMAASYAARYPGADGLVLLASYPASSESLAALALPTVSIYGTNDGLSTGAEIDAARSLLPEDTVYVAIEGGNHAQFGDYGVQQGDGPAAIDHAEQQAQAVEATIALLERISGE